RRWRDGSEFSALARRLGILGAGETARNSRRWRDGSEFSALVIRRGLELSGCNFVSLAGEFMC
ncbi:MAG: hypothetical protein K9J74_09785, partial [Sulfuritalea sp.]|nr:hypothetical protein [Sulfuritalea sp.]